LLNTGNKKITRLNSYKDVDKIIKYCSNMESENPHHVKANYVKKIEVES